MPSVLDFERKGQGQGIGGSGTVTNRRSQGQGSMIYFIGVREAPDAVRRLLRRTGRSGFAWSYALEACLWDFVWLVLKIPRARPLFEVFVLPRFLSMDWLRYSCLDRRTIRVSSRDILCNT